MIDGTHSFLFYISVLGILLSLILFAYSFRQAPFNKYLAGFFFCMNLYCLAHYVTAYSGSATALRLIYGTVSPLYHLIGPLAFFYVRSCVRDNGKLSKRDIIHFIPFMIDLLGALPHILDINGNAEEIARSIAQNKDLIPEINTNRIIPAKINYALRPILWIFYGFLAWITLIKNRELIQKNTIRKQFRLMLVWIVSFLTVYSISLVSYFIMMMILLNTSVTHGLEYGTYLLIISCTGCALLNLAPFLFPDLIFGMIRFRTNPAQHPLIYIPQPRLSFPVPEEQPVPPEAQTTVPKSGFMLNETYLKEIEEILFAKVEEDKLFTQADFSLESIIQATNIPKHHLYYYFQHHLNKKFTAYRTELRLNHALALLNKGENTQLTMEGVARSAGFSSRTTFYTAFKQQFGKSPNEYLQSREVE